MQPEQYPVPAPTPPPNDDWLKNYQPNKPGVPKQRLVIMVAAIGIVLGVVFLLLTSLTGGESVESRVRKIAASQQEILRITDLALETENATSDTYDLAATISVVSNSNMQQLTSITGELKKEELALAVDSNVDTTLQTAAQTNTFDSAFPVVMKTELTELNNSLSAIFNEAENQKLKTILSQAYDNNKELLVAISDSAKN